MKKISLETQTLIAVGMGIVFGYAIPEAAASTLFVGKIYVGLLKMIIIPLVSTSVFTAIAGKDDSEALKGLGKKTAGYYLVTGVMASLVGLICANLFFPFQDNFQSQLSFSGEKPGALTLGQFFLSFVPQNPLEAFVSGDMVKILVFVILCALVAKQLPRETRKKFIAPIEGLNELFQLLTFKLVKLAPIGAFFLIGGFVTKMLGQNFNDYLKFFYATTLALIVHSLFTLGAIARFIGGFSLFKFFGQVSEAIFLAFTTQSSSATLPVSMRVLEENADVSPEVARLTAPLGATLNMDGSALYHALLLLFFAQLEGIHLGPMQQLAIIFLTQVSSAGTAGIPSGGLMMMSMMLGFLKLPADYLALYFLLDRFWDMPVTAVNVWGDLVGAKTIDKLHLSRPR